LKNYFVEVDSFYVQLPDNADFNDVSKKIIQYLKSEMIGFKYEEEE